ncbi:MAG: methylmalonyl Co-A mutase-associated GTPase MeaB [Chloroflexi bacterium]|nr:methylmalonyl Co-A mutase-associated GTPase MeaB [Chloroflexota bacterium]
MNILNQVLNGDVRAAAKLIRGIEDDIPEATAAMGEIYLHSGRAHIVGITGAPGAGKSTLLGCLIGEFRKRSKKVGVVAIDPTSQLSGGALLGDRIRMQKYCTDKDVFIRSLASRGWKGGLSRAAINTVHVMDAMGKDIIFVETIGAGQAEVDISHVADTSLVVLVPGMGDDIQMMKAGIMEVADIFVINKADREGADGLRISLETMLDGSPRQHEISHHSGINDVSPETPPDPGAHRPDEWRPSILLTEAINNKGIRELADEIERHREFLTSSGKLAERRRERAKLELTMAVETTLRSHLQKTDECYLDTLIDDLVQRKTDLNTAALKVIKLPTEL